MTAEHVATGNALTRDLVEAVVGFVNERADYIVNQAAGISPNPARFALNDLMAEMRDHLQIDFAVTLATFGIGEPQS